MVKQILVLGLVLGLGWGIALHAEDGDLSGKWKTTLLVDPLAVTFDALLGFETQLTVTYGIAGWEFTTFSAIDDSVGWDNLTFSAEGELGAFSFSALLDLDPIPLVAYFESWNVTTGVAIAGMTFGADFTLQTEEVLLVISGSGSAGLVRIDFLSQFGDPSLAGCDFNWTGAGITVRFPFDCTNVTAMIAFDCNGYVESSFAVAGIAIPHLPWFTIDAKLWYWLDDKDVVLTPQFSFGVDVCIDLYIGVDWDGSLRIGDIWIEGIGVECEIGGVTFTGISFWGGDPAVTVPAAPNLLGYWEMYKISSTETACCGDFDFDIAVYFDELNATLFEVALFVANFSYELGEAFTFTTGFEFDVVSGLVEWTLGFIVTW